MKVDWKLISSVFVSIFTILLLLILLVEIFTIGYKLGFNGGVESYEKALTSLEEGKVSAYIPTPPPNKKEVPVQTLEPKVVNVAWGGPDLWEVLNRSRVDHGVGPLTQKDELCTIASIRLNELLTLGKLDGHEGFSTLPERRSDLRWIFEKYVIAEFLVQGAESAQEAVDLWLNTMGHKKLITGGEYVYGCTYAQNTFAVAIAAYQ